MNFLHKLMSVEHSPAHLMLKLVANDDLPILCTVTNMIYKLTLAIRSVKRQFGKLFVYLLSSNLANVSNIA